MPNVVASDLISWVFNFDGFSLDPDVKSGHIDRDTLRSRRRIENRSHF